MSQLATVHPLDILAAANGNGSKPPLRTLGYVEDSAFGGLLVDEFERPQDVAWPESVNTYNQMRRDSKLAAILDGYKLQLRRAMWQLDGTNSRPEVVDLVADDLGLNVQGKDTPTAARTRGVSWGEHLRSALSMLDFGHFGAELQAEMVDGKARLIGLWERPQHTIVSMHADPKTGQFTGISQELTHTARPFDKPGISADRLVWYAHEPEGAGWWGTALIRPAFAPWLFKKEMMRVLATSSRRFGMGVPTVRWPQQMSPTPQQMSEAQKLASAARVGDQSGAVLPPGAWLELVGMSGGAPDTLGFVQWLDQQMSVSVLMQHLDLGQTATGSRALGESFIDSWLLALEAIGEYVADVATRQIAARLVAWNWGEDEPVPRVVVSGIGSRREVTAQSLQLLLDSGALAADPGLEEWVRREYRLPERTTPRPAQVQNPQRPTQSASQPAQQQRQVQAAAITAYEQPALPLEVEAFNPGWKDQPRRKDRGLQDHGGRWVDDAGGGTAPDVGVRQAPSRRGGTSPGERQPTTRPTAQWRTPLRMQALQDRMLADGPWNENQQSALQEYSDYAYEAMNDALRSGGDVDDETRWLIHDAASAMRPLPQPVTVSRRVNLDAFGEGADLDTVRALVGETVQDPGFMSTTIDRGAAVVGGRVALTIHVPAGAPAAYVESVTRLKDEHELILAPGTTLRLLSTANGPAGSLRVEAEVVP